MQSDGELLQAVVPEAADAEVEPAIAADTVDTADCIASCGSEYTEGMNERSVAETATSFKAEGNMLKFVQSKHKPTIQREKSSI